MIKILVKTAISVVCTAFITGCGLAEWARNGMKVGPEYKAPATAVAPQWIDYHGAATRPAEVTQWWSVFKDPVLNSLMHDAYAENPSLRTAGERIAEARAVRGISIGNLFPQTQNVAGALSVNKASNRVAAPLGDQWFQNANGGLNVGWELDFWGRFRRAIEASDASLEASVADYDNVMVLMLAEVASSYIQYRTFQERLALARQNVEIQRQAYDLASNNFHAGAATERDMQQARQVYEQTRSLIPQFELGIRLSNNSLCALLGIPVQNLSSRLGETGTIPLAPAEVAMGIPAELLRRRPDVRQAERIAAAQSAQIGVAVSDLYPHFSINGSIGVSAEYIGGMWHTPGAMAGSFGPSFRWDILNYGRIQNSIKGQEARFREFIDQYQQTVLQADREAENAIISFVKSKERAVYLTDSVSSARRTVGITYDQYRAGAVDFTPVFIFESTLTEQEDALAQAKGDIALNLVELYRSLGGGWEARMVPEGIVGPPTTAPTTQRAPGRPDLLTPAPAPAPAATTRPA